jgi:hypothetical protein
VGPIPCFEVVGGAVRVKSHALSGLVVVWGRKGGSTSRALRWLAVLCVGRKGPTIPCFEVVGRTVWEERGSTAEVERVSRPGVLGGLPGAVIRGEVRRTEFRRLGTAGVLGVAEEPCWVLVPELVRGLGWPRKGLRLGCRHVPCCLRAAVGLV